MPFPNVHYCFVHVQLKTLLELTLVELEYVTIHKSIFVKILIKRLLASKLGSPNNVCLKSEKIGQVDCDNRVHTCIAQQNSSTSLTYSDIVALCNYFIRLTIWNFPWIKQHIHLYVMRSRGISRKSNIRHFQFSIWLKSSFGEVCFAETPLVSVQWFQGYEQLMDSQNRKQ